MRPTALIVEHDPDTRHLLSSTLASAGIASLHAPTGAAMWQQLVQAPSIVILDLALPDGDGLELLRQLRRTSDVPVLIHTTASNEIERILGIEIGADDFLPKPCNLRELLARVRALLRRTQRSTLLSHGERPRLRFDAWTLDTASRTLIHPERPPATLGVSAYALLRTFLDHPFEPLSRETLCRVLQREYVPYDRLVDVHVSQIRRTLGRQADGSSFIKTLRAQGYIFVADVAPRQ